MYNKQKDHNGYYHKIKVHFDCYIKWGSFHFTTIFFTKSLFDIVFSYDVTLK